MGNRSFRPLPVAMSLLTSYISAISFLGITGEIYAHGMQFGVFILGGVLAIIFTIYFVLPILYPLKLTSINEVSFYFNIFKYFIPINYSVFCPLRV
ncbi:hypothetical protein Anas_00223 [Armadillidium nasatum]|uniref:Sodium-coupled monocarboxylate transporter 1 n=1 Tax=Armadillidium nasatum TaxID=96803 RepID=A0A5N5TM04_9CRUS|nr:hypothetical protein Anas_00223 [Armadillidium nasatum]